MADAQRVVQHLNQALHQLLAEDERVYLIGEDILDPYGGAFKVSRGLSTAFPERVIGTPISEGAFTGFAAGLALMGDKPIVEMMFCDFVTLAYDQIVNFISKSVTMYGRSIPMNLIVRCPYGGHRGYGATHSQSLQKIFIGFPNLTVWEINPFVDLHELFRSILNSGIPAVLFEHKLVYGMQRRTDGVVDDLFRYEFIDDDRLTVRVHVPIADQPQVAILTAGGMLESGVAALRELLVEEEILGEMLMLTKLYPLELAPLIPYLERVSAIVVVEEGSPGGTWGAEILQQLHTAGYSDLVGKLHFVTAGPSVIPSARQLEAQVLPGKASIRQCVIRACKPAVSPGETTDSGSSDGQELEEIVSRIESQNAIHGRKLRTLLETMDEDYFSRSRRFLGRYRRYLKKCGKSTDDAVQDYLRMCEDFVVEQAKFQRTGRYSLSTFAEAEAKVYSNPETMEYYMHGLLLSQFLWGHHYRVLDFFINHLPTFGGEVGRYLEIGCGHGLYLNAATELLSQQVHYQALDISATSIEMARHFVGSDEVEYLQRNIFDHEVTKGVDLITAGEIIEHLEEPIAFLDKVHRLLAEKGVLFITVPVNAPAIDHIYLFERAEDARDMLRESGFEIVEELEAYAEDQPDVYDPKVRIPLMYAAFARKRTGRAAQ